MLICRYWSSGFLHCCKLPVLTAKRSSSSKRSAQKDQCALHVLESGAGRAMELRAAYSRSSGGMQRVLPAQVEERCSTLLLAAEQERLEAKPQCAVEELFSWPSCLHHTASGGVHFIVASSQNCCSGI